MGRRTACIHIISLCKATDRICAKCATKGNRGLSCTKNTFQKKRTSCRCNSTCDRGQPTPAQRNAPVPKLPPMQPAALYTTLLFSPLRLSPQLRSLVQIPNLAELIQTSDVEVRGEQRAEHRLSAWEEVRLHLPSIAIELEDIHVFVVVSKLILIFFIVMACAIHLYAFDQRLALGFVAKTLEC